MADTADQPSGMLFDMDATLSVPGFLVRSA
jgi:hypothetical protein